MSDRDRPFDLIQCLNDIHRHLNYDDIRNSDYLLEMRKQFTDVVTRIDLILLRDHKHQARVKDLFNDNQ